MKSLKVESDRLKAVYNELWSIKTELLSLAHLLGSMDPENGGDEFLGVSLILGKHVQTIENLIEGAPSQKP